MEFLVAGATAIQLGTVNFYNPKASMEVLDALPEALSAAGVERVTDIVGTLVTNSELKTRQGDNETRRQGDGVRICSLFSVLCSGSRFLVHHSSFGDHSQFSIPSSHAARSSAKVPATILARIWRIRSSRKATLWRLTRRIPSNSRARKR